AKTQARIDSGRQTVVGVNKFRLADEEAVSVLKIDNTVVRAKQIEKLERLRAERDPKAVKEALNALTNAANASGANANLLALAIGAARAKATVGEISDALEAVYGRHRARIQSIQGVYLKEMGQSSEITAEAREAAQKFETVEGRKPRVMVAKVGQDGHDRGQKVVSSGFADLGWDVDIGALFATPAEVAKVAIENDVHIVGVSSLAAGHLTLVPELKAELAKAGHADIQIVVGGVIPPDDVPTLLEMGATHVFTPGTMIANSALDLVKALAKKRGHPDA
ncbi:MAG: methylmalonyl-CoA mutase family protein, partial [Caulobacterales bacterium]